MKKRSGSRLLAAFLAVLLLTQSLCLTAFAAAAASVIIPADSSAEAVNAILSEALLGEGAETQAWEYKCEGKTAIGTWGNESWGSIAGFTIETGKVIKTKYTHPSLAANEDGTYQVRVAGTTEPKKIEKAAKLAGSIAVNEGQSVVLLYNADGSVNYDCTKQAIFDSVATSTTPALTADDVTMEYFASLSTGSVTDLDKAWVPLEGKKVGLLTYPGISEGTHEIRISWSGSDAYYGFEKEVEVTLTGRRDAEIELNEDPQAALNSPDLKAAVFAAVVKSSEPALTAEDVDIQYQTKTLVGTAKWNDLSGLTETGTYTIRISWDGNDTYNGFEKTADIQIVSGKAVSSIQLKDQAEAAMVYGDDGAADIAATKAAVFAAVVESIEPKLTVDDVTMEYNAAKTGLTEVWVPLTGGTGIYSAYPAISEGTHKIRISWDGNDAYDGFGWAEATITLTSRPEAPYTLQDPVGSVKLVYNDDLTVDYSTIAADVFGAVIAGSDVLTVDNVTLEYYATAATGAVGSLGRAWVPLTGAKVNGLTYPAIPEGTQQVRITYAGDKTYAPTTVEAAIEVKGREPMTFNLKEGPYEVGMVFTADQGYDYDATAKAIYDAVVESTEPAVDFSEITVEYNAGTNLAPIYKALSESLLTTEFRDGTWTIRISWGGSKDYAPGSVEVSVTVTDNRIASEVVLKSGAAFTYNKDVNAMKQAVLDSVIDWDNSTLPAKDTLSIDDFTFQYQAQLSLLDGVSGNIADKIIDQIMGNVDIQKAYVPFEGKTYELEGLVLGKYPQIGAGQQQIKVTYTGNADYKPSSAAEGTVTVNKANVKVSVKSTSIYVSQADGLNMVSTDSVDDFNMYVIYAGITSNVTTGVYLELPERYTENSALLKVADTLLAKLNQPTLTEMMQNGITVGELRNLLNTTEVIDALEKIGVDTGSLGHLIKVINKLPAIGDNLRIAFGTPNRAGIYAVTAVSESKNYNTGVGVGALVLKADKAQLVWNQSIGKKISAADAQTADFGATLQVNGEAVKDQSSVHVLYSGFTSKWKVYSSTTTPPTEPGRYTMTVVVLGGNYLASPINRSFQITK